MTMSESYAVRTEGLTKRYGRAEVVSSLDLRVPDGAFYLLIGPNGAGKTTTFRMLLGLTSPTSGTMQVAGASRSGGEARARIGFVPEMHELPYGWLRVDRLVAHHAGYYGAWDAEYARRLVDILEIRMDAKYGKLSKGQARRVQLLLALAHRPPVLLLDEPTDGLDPVARDTVQAVLAEHVAETPTTVLVATHLVYEMERFADHVGVLRSGRLVKQMARSEMHARLKRYVLDVPDDWRSDLERELPLVSANGTPRERRWTIWGDETDIRQRLSAAGANVRSVTTLTLDEAALALLSGKEQA
ncbi:MAG TPA: ABC transporter ATP-binding protein [Longimicrobiales bacterium]|nr:ABC transporter ATP-binding protein [Longimicrobiales bacterium]